MWHTPLALPAPHSRCHDKVTVVTDLPTPPSQAPQAAEQGQPGGRKRPAPRAPGQHVECGWCGHPVPVPARGRVPKWCSGACRHRAWEQARAAASGLAAVEIRDRVVETTKTVTVVQHHTREVPTVWRPGSVPDFVEVLHDLTNRLDSGRVYDRDLPALAPAVVDLVAALTGRQSATGHP